jgi:NDP-sugar pyrophosphorylase family protein
MINIVIPMAGRGSRFAEAGYPNPKPLIPVGGMPMIEWVVENVRPQRDHRFHFICQAEHLRVYSDIEIKLKEIAPSCTVTTVEEVTEGAACTVLLAEQFINNDDELMIANSDQYVEVDIDEYLQFQDNSECEGLIMSFKDNDPKWSYCRFDGHGRVTEVVEKQVVSDEATVGIYNFKKGSDFVAAAKEMIEDDFRVNGEFYVAPAYNYLINKGTMILPFRIASGLGGMHGLGTPTDLLDFRATQAYQQNARNPQAELKEMTLAYIQAFSRKDLTKLQILFSKDAYLKDPVGKFEPALEVLKYVKGIFDGSDADVPFSAKRVLVDEAASTTIIDFNIEIGGDKLEGADLIEWRNGQIQSLVAYM